MEKAKCGGIKEIIGVFFVLVFLYVKGSRKVGYAQLFPLLCSGLPPLLATARLSWEVYAGNKRSHMVLMHCDCSYAEWAASSIC